MATYTARKLRCAQVRAYPGRGEDCLDSGYERGNTAWYSGNRVRSRLGDAVRRRRTTHGYGLGTIVLLGKWSVVRHPSHFETSFVTR